MLKIKKPGMYKYIHIRNIVCTHSVEKGGEALVSNIPKIRGHFVCIHAWLVI